MMKYFRSAVIGCCTLALLLLTACTGSDTACNEHGVCMTGYSTLAGSKIVTGRVYFDIDSPKDFQPGGGETSETLPVVILQSVLPAAALVGAAQVLELGPDINIPSMPTDFIGARP